MKILILVLSYNDNSIYTDFYNTQKETWDSIKIEGIDTYYYFGNHNNDIIVDNEILVNIPEGNYTEKMIKAFEMIKDFNFDYIFRTNSSSYVDKELLLKYIKNKPKENFYSGFIGNYNNIYFASGSGFFLSRDLFDIIIKNKEKIDIYLLDDVSIGKFLTDRGFEIFNSERLDILDNIFDKTDLNYFHYRLKTFDRRNDINNMKKIFNLKNNKNGTY